ncbi:MAG: hypothetical protein J6T96_09270 [Bacteroidales bacterium]|nr:hypothetical protein [Bacteroidales bacterium]
MNKKKLTIWNRDFDLDIVFDVFAGEKITAQQQKALDAFLANASIIDICKSKVEDYCIKNSNGQIEKVDNIFKYVIPKALFVVRTKTKTRIVAVMCNFKFDMEHGMAIVFRNEQFSEIGEEGIIA